MSSVPLDAELPTRSDAESSTRVGRLLVWIGGNAYAEALVRHAHQWVSSGNMPWTVISVETPGTQLHSAQQRAEALRALLLAERLGASTDSVTAENVLAAIVERVRQERATMVMVGGHPPDGWLEVGRRHWLGGLADALSSRLPDVTVNVVQYPQGSGRAETTPMPVSRPPQMSWPGALLSLAVVALCTAIAGVMEPYFTLGTIDIVYLAGVVYVALHLGEAAALLAVFTSIFMFDLIFVPPRWSLKPTDPQYYFSFVVMLIVGVLISRLVTHARMQALLAAARARRAQALNELARHLVTARSDSDIGAGLAAAVESTFGAPAALLLPDERGLLVDPSGFCANGSTASGAATPGQGLAVAQRLFDQGGGVADQAMLHLLLSGTAGPLGVLVVRPLPARFGTPEDRHLLEAFANQSALALERWLFERRSATAVVVAETEQLRNTLLSAISHDFRTPLTTIIGSASSLLEQDAALDAARRQYLLRSLVGEARRMHASMSDLLDLTRMEEGAVQTNCEWCPADELVAEVLQGLAPRLGDHAVRTHIAPDAIVWCDPRLMQQALINLLDNARRHTPAHSTIDVRVELDEACWRLVVADNGPGLPPGREVDVFKKFYRAEPEPAGAGNGLGLAICAAVARLHGGRIEARTAGGACFTMTLPQPAPPVAPIGDGA